MQTEDTGWEALQRLHVLLLMYQDQLLALHDRVMPNTVQQLEGMGLCQRSISSKGWMYSVLTDKGIAVVKSTLAGFTKATRNTVGE